MQYVATLLSLLLHSHSCTASVFGGPSDAYAGGDAACLNRPINAHDIGIAIRNGKCGSRVLLVHPRTGKSIIATVIDHGPYGSVLPDGTWALKRKHSDPGQWRGCIDMTPATAKALQHNGMEAVMYMEIENVR